MQPLLDIGAATGTTALIKPIVDLISPVTRVLIETGYDRSNYGQPSPFGLIPAIDPIKLTADLASAVGQGIHDALGDLGGSTPIPAAPSAPATTLAAATAKTSQTASNPTPAVHSAPQPLGRKRADARNSLVAACDPVTAPARSSLNSPLPKTASDIADTVRNLVPKAHRQAGADQPGAPAGATAGSARPGTGAAA